MFQVIKKDTLYSKKKFIDESKNYMAARYIISNNSQPEDFVILEGIPQKPETIHIFSFNQHGNESIVDHRCNEGVNCKFHKLPLDFSKIVI